MKNFAVLLIASLSFCTLYGQKAMSFTEAKKQGITIQGLDSLYTNAMDDGTGNFVFDNGDTVSAAMTKMFADISAFMRRKEDMRKIEVQIFQRVYFNKDGKVDYYIYKIRNADQLSEEECQKIDDLLNEFIKDYQFSLSADKGFVQCGTAKYTTE